MTDIRTISFRSRIPGATALALVTSTTLLPVISARAAAVVTRDLEAQAAPSFSTLVERVKPAVVSVKMQIENAVAKTDDLADQMNNLPPQIQGFLKRYGQENSGQGNSSRGKKPAAHLSMAQGSGFSFPPMASW